MKFQNTLTLLGVVGKCATGTLDNGKPWSTDRVELHTLSEFDDSDSMSVGQTITVYKVEDYSANFEKAKSCVGQRIVCDFEMVAGKTPGQLPKLLMKNFSPEKVTKTS